MKLLILLITLAYADHLRATDFNQLQGKWKSCSRDKEQTYRSITFLFKQNLLDYTVSTHSKSDCSDSALQIQSIQSQVSYIRDGEILIHADDSIDDQTLIIKEEGSAYTFELILPGISAYLGRFYKED